ncbi:hypothetical protein BT69DRAFT_1280840 [Atractiella rhizophila]|nr:hypothetical protein BT69DRAFT_1280840 [Atractiella rhizophila]
MALVHVINTEHYPDSIHLSILPSLLSRLPPSINMLRISFALTRSLRTRKFAEPSSRLSSLSLERVENVVDKDGAINVCITINAVHVSVTLLAVEEHSSSIERNIKSRFYPLASYFDPFTRTFPFFRENAIFAPIASYSEQEGFTPISDDESSTLPSLRAASIIQIFAPPPDVIRSSISGLPVELLSLIFSLSYDPFTFSEVCKLWKEVSVPYWGEHVSLVQKYERLKRYLGAGRLWNELVFNKSMDVGMVKEVITGSPNVTEVVMFAFWNEEEAKMVLNAIEGLKRVNEARFWRSSRKWRKEEIENFMQRMDDRIRRLTVRDVEDCPASASPSEGLHLPSRLEYLRLHKYPPLPSLPLPHTLKCLELSNMCPLPSSISEYPLPPILNILWIDLAPFSADVKTSILLTPLDLSHLTCLTQLFLDGGDEKSNLVPREFFSTLKNATGIFWITLRYCVVSSFDFPDFIRCFFGDWQERGAEKGDRKDGQRMGDDLEVRLFFGEWSEEEIVIARRTMGEYANRERSRWSGVWEAGE